MLNSIHLILSFKEARDAYRCLKQVNSLQSPSLEKAFYSKGAYPHIVVVKLNRPGSCLLDQIDVHILADYIPAQDYYWTLSTMSTEEIIYDKRRWS